MIGTLRNRLGFALEVLAHGVPRVAEPRASYPGLIPRASPLTREEGAAARQIAALRMMDEDCFGFLVFTVHVEGREGDIRMAAHLNDSWWPAMAATLERVAGSVPR